MRDIIRIMISANKVIGGGRRSVTDLVWKVAACALGRSFPLTVVECECLKQATLYIYLAAQ